MAPAPRGGNHPVRVFSARNVTEAQLAVAFLGESGIPATVEDEHFREVLDGVADNIGRPGVGVVVASDREVEASRAIERFRHPAPFDDEDFKTEPDDESG